MARDTAEASQQLHVSTPPIGPGTGAVGQPGAVHGGASPVVYSFEDVIQGGGPIVEARFVLEDGRSGWLWVFASGGDLLGAVQPKLVWFAKGRSGTVEPQLTSNLLGNAGGGLGVARATDTRWEWFALAHDHLATTAGQPPSLRAALAVAMPLYFGATSTGWASCVTHHDVYVIRRLPQAPWVQQPYSAANRYLPWTRVLEFACDMPAKIPAGMVAAETVKEISNVDEMLALHLCVGLWPKPGQEALVGLVYNSQSTKFLPPESQLTTAPEIDLTSILSDLDSVRLSLQSGLRDPADLSWSNTSCTRWGFSWILELFGGTIGIPMRSVAIFGEPLPSNGNLPKENKIKVWSFVPHGVGGLWETTASHITKEGYRTTYWESPPQKANIVGFRNHVFCIASSSDAPVNGQLPPDARIFDLTMWANRLEGVEKWIAGDTYGLPFLSPVQPFYAQRRLVNPKQPIFAYLLPTPKRVWLKICLEAEP